MKETESFPLYLSCYNTRIGCGRTRPRKTERLLVAAPCTVMRRERMLHAFPFSGPRCLRVSACERKRGREREREKRTKREGRIEE